MAGIYIHIPFCKQACTYCNFHFSVNLKQAPALLNALEREIRESPARFPEPEISSLYFGGGTPSILAPEDIALLIFAVRQSYNLLPDAEITLEANPDDILPENLQVWKEMGINRLSIGVQSLDEAELRHMNRSHGAQQARTCIELARQQGFHDLNLDLIYGSEWLSDENWQAHMDWAFESGVQHISAYGLTVEPRTRLGKQVEKGLLKGPEEEKQARQYLMLAAEAEKRGWDFYEISNLCKPGHRARHNSSYWANEPYLGIGPSAHSFHGKTRSWNVADNARYIEAIGSGEPSRENEELGAGEILNEYLLTHLRLVEGVDLNHAEALLPGWALNNQKSMAEFAEQGLARLENSHILLTASGRLLADRISAELMA